MNGTSPLSLEAIFGSHVKGIFPAQFQGVNGAYEINFLKTRDQIREMPEKEIEQCEETLFSLPGDHDFASFTLDQKKAVKRKLMELDNNGRLFIEDQGRLKRCSTIEAVIALDNHIPVTIVDLITKTDDSRSIYTDEFHANAVNFLVIGGTDAIRDISDEARYDVDLNYITSNIKNWPQLSVVNSGIPGIKGAPYIPKNCNNKLTINKYWEHSWLTMSMSTAELFGGYVGAAASSYVEKGHSRKSASFSR